MDNKKQKILTIDLDFLYPKMNLIESKDLDKFSITEYINIFNLDFIKLILNTVHYKELIIIDSHDEVLNYLDENNKIELINIDYHHDFGYSEEQLSSVDLNNFFELNKEDKESCWIYYLFKQNKLIDYTWIGSEKSEFELSILKHGFKFYLEQGNTIKPFNYDLPVEVDKIIICKSFNYINKKQVEYAIRQFR